jgi:hypothetical protein
MAQKTLALMENEHRSILARKEMCEAKQTEEEAD